MKALVVYASQTGNTKNLAETVCTALPAGTLLCTVDEAPDPAEFDFVALGFWLKAGKPEPKSAAFLERLKGHNKLFLFASHGARPDSDHARNAMQQACSLAEGASIAGTFSCQGEVSTKILAKAGSKPQPPVWVDDAPQAAGHPDQTDRQNLLNALQAALG